MYQYREILGRMRVGDSDRDLARSGLLGRDRAATFRGLAQSQGWLEPGAVLPEDAAISALLGKAKRPASTVSAAEPWRAQIKAWDEQGVQGTTIHAALRRDHGFTGSYSSVVRFLNGLHAARQPDLTVRLQFAPGEAAQVDFGAGPMMRHPAGDERRTWAFVMTLGFSRHQYVEFVWDQTVATWLGCHRRAFEWFAGVPKRLIIDNAKCAIVKACRNDPEVQRGYGECALGYGFKIDPCPPHDPQKKGIVESGVKYVKRNFLPLRQFRDLADLNAQVRRWVLDEAGIRQHGTTRQAPLHLFKLEQPALSPLPAMAPDLSTWRRANLHRDCHLQFDYAYYSAPFTLVGKRLWLRITDASVAIYHEYSHVYTHGRAVRPGQRQTIRDHLPPDAASFLAHDRLWCEAQATDIGADCLTFIQRLLSHEILIHLRAAQNVLRLARTYTPERLEAACHRALAHDSIHYVTVKSILRGGFDRLAPVAPDDKPYVSHARFIRNAESLFGSLQ